MYLRKREGSVEPTPYVSDVKTVDGVDESLLIEGGSVLKRVRLEELRQSRSLLRAIVLLGEGIADGSRRTILDDLRDDDESSDGSDNDELSSFFLVHDVPFIVS